MNLTLEELHALNNALAYSLSEYMGGEAGRAMMERLYDYFRSQLETKRNTASPGIRIIDMSDLTREDLLPEEPRPYVFGDGIQKDYATRLETSPIQCWCGSWAVTDYGVECLTEYYPIPWDRVDETDWKAHMAYKNWVIADDFNAALDYARTHRKREAQP